MRFSVTSLSLIAAALASCGSDNADEPLHGNPGEQAIVVDTYSSLEACIAAGRFDRSACSQASQIALTKHPHYAEKFGDIAVCEEIYGPDSCDTFKIEQKTYASPRPVGFLVCSKEPAGCRTQIFAPTYRNMEWGEFTGTGGGFISPSERHRGRSQISGTVLRRPII